MNIYNIPVFYISFTKKPELEQQLKDIGFSDINHFLAIDGRKRDIDELNKNNLITIRTYKDLKTKRTQHYGLPSLGAVGCTLSHYELWKKCVDEYDHIVILEDDVDINRKLTQNELEYINECLQEENGGFISNSSNIDDSFIGTHFYICSKGMCNELVKHAFPIDVQTDFYMDHLSKMDKINVGCKKIFGQKIHPSSIQELCIKCILPDNLYYYLFFITIFIIILILLVYLFFTRVYQVRMN
jgi:hypothetical protein